MRPEAIRQMLAWSDRLSDVAIRAAVVGALEGFFSEWPQALSRMFEAPEREVIQAGLGLAGRLKHPDFVDIVGEVAGHEDPRVRLAVAETLALIGSAPALRRLTPMGEDGDRDVRLVVYRTLATRPFRPAFGTLQRAIASRDLEERGQREKRALFEAFGRIAGPEGPPVLEPLLRGRNPSGQRPSAHTRACAAIALGLVDTPDARAALSRAASDKDPLVRSAVGAALRGDVAP
jgi:HEAT repeat protein